MKNCLLTICFFVITSLSVNAQSIVGKWKTIDDTTKAAKSIVEFVEKDGVYSAKVVSLINPKVDDPKCDNCTGVQKGKSIKGLVIITGLVKNGNEYTGGKIVDPESGKVYKCTVKLNGADKVDVRGFVGVSLLGRTQTWVRQ